MEIAAKTRAELQKIYGGRLKNVYLYGSAARDQLTPDSDIDIAIILNEIGDRYTEHKRVSQLGADISLQNDTVVLFLFASQKEFEAGQRAIFRNIAREGIQA